MKLYIKIGLTIFDRFQVKYDLLVSNAIKFLTSVAERPQYAELFSNEDTLKNICEKVLVPNMKLRGESDCT